MPEEDGEVEQLREEQRKGLGEKGEGKLRDEAGRVGVDEDDDQDEEGEIRRRSDTPTMDRSLPRRSRTRLELT